MTNIELQELLKRYPDDSKLIFSVDAELGDLYVDGVYCDLHPERNELSMNLSWRNIDD